MAGIQALSAPALKDQSNKQTKTNNKHMVKIDGFST